MSRLGAILACSAVAAGLGIFSVQVSHSEAIVDDEPSQRRSSVPSLEPWYAKALVGLEVGPTGAQFGNSDPSDTRFCSAFDGRAIVRACLEAKADYLVLWVRDGDYAYYDSKLLPKAPGLAGRDPLGEAIEAARPHGLPVIAYCVVQQAGHFLAAHPEWAMRDAAGQPIGRFCFNSGYLEAMKQIVAEIASHGVDGFHIDMLDQGFGPPYGCWCESCRERFEQQYGHAMPGGATWDRTWDEMLDFRYRSSADFERQLYASIKEIHPQLSVDFNYHGNPPFSFEVGQRPRQHAVLGDFVTGETGVWGFSALAVGLNAEFYRAGVSGISRPPTDRGLSNVGRLPSADPGSPESTRDAMRFQVAMQRGVRMYHDQTTRPLTDLRWELLTLLAHGGFVTMVDKTGLEGHLDPVAYQRIAAAFADAKQRRGDFGQPPVYDVGLYYSSRARDWIGRESAGEWQRSFMGAHRTMVYEHLSFGVVLDETASGETLQRFPVIILPNVGCCSLDEISCLRRYVESGGHLIVTGQTGVFDSMGEPLSADDPSPVVVAWSDLIGARTVRRLDTLDNWVELTSDLPAAYCAEIPRDWPFLIKGPATVYRPTRATAYGRLREPARTTRQREGREGTQWPMSPADEIGPALLVNEIGKGRVWTCAAGPDYATASEHATVESRQFLSSLVRWAVPRPLVRVTAPVNVETVVTQEQDSGLIRVHLLSYDGPPQTTPAAGRPAVMPALLEDEPLYRVKLQLDQPVLKVESHQSQTELKFADREIEATISGIHEVLRITCRPDANR
jgi:hypothetical protein